jgi:hypothetical protein
MTTLTIMLIIQQCKNIFRVSFQFLETCTFVFVIYRKPKVNGLNGFAGKEPWADGK